MSSRMARRARAGSEVDSASGLANFYQINRDYCGGFGFGQRFSLFWLDLKWFLIVAAVEIVDAEFVVVADAVGESAL